VSFQITLIAITFFIASQFRQKICWRGLCRPTWLRFAMWGHLRKGAVVILTAALGAVALMYVWTVWVYGPEDRTDAQAKVYFDEQRPTFDALVRLVSQCEGLGRLDIYPDSHTFSIHDHVTCPSITEISTHLKATKILWVSADSRKPYGEQGPFSATFVLSSRGIVGHGSGSAIYHFPELEQKIPFGDSFPLEGMPGHWFYHRASSAR
jgi:hypothetical protein